jgi:tRNA (adenine57-N1/adenine58-N1)-methyltransferase
MPTAKSGQLHAGDSVLFIDRKDRQYLRILEPGQRLHLRAGTFATDDLIGRDEGSTVRNTAGEPFLILRPTYSQLIPNLPRQAQVIYPKDIGPILLWGDIYPGATVIEVGTGAGALSIALLRAVGPNGRLISYEAREDFAEMARRNVRHFHGESPNWEVKIRDAFEGFDETDVDRMTIDLAEPWHLLPMASAALRPGGLIVGYVPTIVQVKQFIDALRQHGGFGAIETFETLQRFWHVEGLSVRPEHRMVAHTGFIVVARVVVPQDRPATHAPDGGMPFEDESEVTGDR